MKADDAIRELAAGLGDAFRAAGHPGLDEAMAAWPTADAPLEPTVPTTLPVLDLLAAYDNDDGLAGRLACAAPYLMWRQSYTEAEVGRDYLQRYGWTAVASADAPLCAPGIMAGFLMIGPGLEYPRHNHAAEEFYVVVAGDAAFSLGDAPGWSPRTMGDLVHNPPWQVHGIRIGGDGLCIIAYLWRANGFTKSTFETA